MWRLWNGISGKLKLDKTNGFNWKQADTSSIMNIYRYYGFNEFILALGYKSHYIKIFQKKNKNIKLIYTGKKPRQAEGY